MARVLRREPARAAYKKWVRYPFRPWCEIRKMCNRSSRLWERCAQESVAYTQTVHRYQRTGTVYSSAVRNCILDTCPSDRIQLPERLRSSNSAPALPYRPCAECVAQDDPSLPAGRPAAVSGPDPSSRAVPVSPRRDSRGVHTCDPQTPPSASRTRTVTADFYTTQFKFGLFPRYPIG